MSTNNRTTLFASLLAVGVLASSGCSYLARDTPTYQADTSALLDTKADALQACYDQELARNPSVAGKLTVSFTVEKKTGSVTQLGWDQSRSTISEPLAACVIAALDGLELAQPDQRDGQATFVYTFRNPNAPAGGAESDPGPEPGPGPEEAAEGEDAEAPAA